MEVVASPSVGTSTSSRLACVKRRPAPSSVVLGEAAPMASPFPKLSITIPGYTDVSGHTEYIIKTIVGEAEQHNFAVQHRFSNFIEVCASRMMNAPWHVHEPAARTTCAHRKCAPTLAAFPHSCHCPNCIRSCTKRSPPSFPSFQLPSPFQRACLVASRSSVTA